MTKKLRWVPRGARAAAVCVVLVVCAAAAQTGRAKQQPPVQYGPLPAALQAARDRLTLEHVGSQAFHLQLEFEVTSDTGVKSRGTFTQDWWNELWWRQVTVVNGLRREIVQRAGKLYRDEDDGFLLPFRVQAALLAARRPFPEHAQQQGEEGAMQLQEALLHCYTLPTATEVQDLRPAPKTFCVDEGGNLRLTADPNYRVLYNRVRALGTHAVATTVQMLRGKETVASLKVVQYAVRADGPAELETLSEDDQIRLLLANPRDTLMLSPLLMQRQLLSTDVRMMPHGDAVLRLGQRFALVRVLESEGRLLDAEVLGESDDAARALALRILQTASFRVASDRRRQVAYEGSLLLIAP